MLSAAVLAALAEVGTGDVRIDPHRIFPVRDYVSLACQERHPETMRDVSRLEIEKGRRWTLRITQRNMKLIGSDDAEAGVTELPPPLMRDHMDAERAGRPREVVLKMSLDRGDFRHCS